MASTAISAQGSTLKISTGTGIAKTITQASKSAPCTLTLADTTGVAVGTVGTVAAIVGMTELNGTKAIVQYLSGTKIALANVDSSSYSSYTSGGTFTTQTMTKIGNLKTFGGMDGEAPEINVSNLDSTGAEFLLGLKDEGSLTFDVDWDYADLGQQALEASRSSGALHDFTLTLPNGRTASFSGLVKKFSKSGGVGQAVQSSCSVRISGAVTWA